MGGEREREKGEREGGRERETQSHVQCQSDVECQRLPDTEQPKKDRKRTCSLTYQHTCSLPAKER